jgi:hypothetical protein
MNEKKKIVGVGLILYRVDDQGRMRIRVVRETRAKPLIRKKAGMLSFPLETQETQDEGSIIWTMRRCAGEELGISLDQMVECFPVATEFRLFPEIEQFDIVTRYGIARYIGTLLDAGFSSPSGDTEAAGWMTVPELLARPLIRVETRPIYDHFLREMPHRQKW